MKNYIKKYVQEIDKLLENKQVDEETIKKHLIKIDFFKHERLIHLLVTCFYAIFNVCFIALSFLNPLFIIITLILLTFLAFYVLHYFFLENSVQYMYKQYDKMLDIVEKTKKSSKKA